MLEVCSNLNDSVSLCLSALFGVLSQSNGSQSLLEAGWVMLVPLGSPDFTNHSKHSTGLDQHSGAQILVFPELSPPLLCPCHQLGSSSCPGWDTESSSGGCRLPKSAAQHCPAHHAPPHRALSTPSVEKASSPAATGNCPGLGRPCQRDQRARFAALDCSASSQPSLSLCCRRIKIFQGCQYRVFHQRSLHFKSKMC